MQARDARKIKTKHTLKIIGRRSNAYFNHDPFLIDHSEL